MCDNGPLRVKTDGGYSPTLAEEGSVRPVERGTVSCGTGWATPCPAEGGTVSIKTDGGSPTLAEEGSVRLVEGGTVSCGTG